jgi:hypothetical protein
MRSPAGIAGARFVELSMLYAAEPNATSSARIEMLLAASDVVLLVARADRMLDRADEALRSDWTRLLPERIERIELVLSCSYSNSSMRKLDASADSLRQHISDIPSKSVFLGPH